MSVSLDEERRIGQLGYDVSYPPAPGSAPVLLEITVDILKYGLDGRLSLPPRETVADYEEYVIP